MIYKTFSFISLLLDDNKWKALYISSILYYFIVAKMKFKMSISVDEELVKKIQEQIALGRFRNRSHSVEYAIKKLMKND